MPERGLSNRSLNCAQLGTQGGLRSGGTWGSRSGPGENPLGAWAGTALAFLELVLGCQLPAPAGLRRVCVCVCVCVYARTRATMNTYESTCACVCAPLCTRAEQWDVGWGRLYPGGVAPFPCGQWGRPALLCAAPTEGPWNPTLFPRRSSCEPPLHGGNSLFSGRQAPLCLAHASRLPLEAVS